MSDEGSESSTAIAEDVESTPPGASSPPPGGGGLHRRSPRPRRSPRRLLTEWLGVAIVAVLLAFGIRAFVFQAFYVPTPSMVPALQVGDRILVQKLFFSPSSLRTGDIVVFKAPPGVAQACSSAEADLVKRVIGLPGETIQSKGNTIYLNGKVLAEPWLPKVDPLGPRPIPKYTIPKGEYYMLGDNRAVSCDSRYWGPVPAANIIGKVVLLWWRDGHPAFHIF